MQIFNLCASGDQVPPFELPNQRVSKVSHVIRNGSQTSALDFGKLKDSIVSR